MEEKKEQAKMPYTKPEVVTHEPLRNITAGGPNGMEPTNGEPWAD